jgi:hypothetical protein
MVIPFNLCKGNTVCSPQLCTYDTHYGMLSNSFQNLLLMYTVILLTNRMFQMVQSVAYPGILFGEIQQIQLRTENVDLGAVASYPLVKGSGVSCNFV